MPVLLDRLKKVESASFSKDMSPEADELIELIVKVKSPNYVPSGVAVRARIDPHLFTGEAMASDMAQLEQDSEVVSVALGKKLRTIG